VAGSYLAIAAIAGGVSETALQQVRTDLEATKTALESADPSLIKTGSPMRLGAEITFGFDSALSQGVRVLDHQIKGADQWINGGQTRLICRGL